LTARAEALKDGRVGGESDRHKSNQKGAEKMKKSALACALLSIGAWTAGASAQPQPVTVTLVGDQIRADPDRVIVERRMGSNVVIHWRLPPGADYRFDPTGIVVNGEQTPGGLRPQDQLPNSCPSASPKQVTCINRNTRSGTFKYTIRLLDRDQRPIVLDPLIVNQ